MKEEGYENILEEIESLIKNAKPTTTCLNCEDTLFNYTYAEVYTDKVKEEFITVQEKEKFEKHLWNCPFCYREYILLKYEFSNESESIEKTIYPLAASECQSDSEDEKDESGKFEVDGIQYIVFGDIEGRVYLRFPKDQDVTHIRLDDELFELKIVGTDNIIREIIGYTCTQMDDFLIDYDGHPGKHIISFECNSGDKPLCNDGS